MFDIRPGMHHPSCHGFASAFGSTRSQGGVRHFPRFPVLVGVRFWRVLTSVLSAGQRWSEVMRLRHSRWYRRLPPSVIRTEPRQRLCISARARGRDPETMSRNTALTWLLVAWFLLMCAYLATAEAQTRRQACAGRDDVIAHLKAKFGEERASLMLDAQGNLLEMFSNHETGSWTLTVTLPGGPTCVMNSGEHFFAEPTKPEGGSL